MDCSRAWHTCGMTCLAFSHARHEAATLGTYALLSINKLHDGRQHTSVVRGGTGSNEVVEGG